jgi:hypothetical protein
VSDRNAELGQKSRETPAFQPPKYGQAAAIFALYQAELVNQAETKAPPPRRPGRGKLARIFDSMRPLFRAPAYARVYAPAYVRV